MSPNSSLKSASLKEVVVTMPRVMANGDISLPSNVAFVFKKIESFNVDTCSANIALTTAMRVKCTNIDNREAVMKFLEEKLKARINEVEIKINEKCFKIQRAKSQHAVGNDKDIV